MREEEGREIPYSPFEDAENCEAFQLAENSELTCLRFRVIPSSTSTFFFEIRVFCTIKLSFGFLFLHPSLSFLARKGHVE